MRASSIISLAVSLAVIALAGCGTINKENIDAGANWADKFYSQPNVAEIFRAEGTNMTLTVTGATLVSLSTPVPPKSVIPREPEWYDGLYDTLKTVAPYAFMGWIFTDGGFGSKSTSTVNNNYAQ